MGNRSAGSRVTTVLRTACVAIVLCMAACGRVGFDPRTDSPNAIEDAAPPFLGCHPDALLCEPFEDATAPLWTSSLGLTGKLEPTAGTTGNGVCLQSNAPLENAVLAREFVSVLAGAFYVRMFVRFPSGYSTTGEMDFLHLSNAAATSGLIHLSSAGVGGRLALEVDGAGTLFATSTMTGLDRWACIELAIDVAPASGSGTLFMDEVAAGMTPSGPTIVTDGWARIELGIDTFAGSTPPPARVCYDELIIARSSIGCVRPAGP